MTSVDLIDALGDNFPIRFNIIVCEATILRVKDHHQFTRYFFIRSLHLIFCFLYCCLAQGETTGIPAPPNLSQENLIEQQTAEHTPPSPPTTLPPKLNSPTQTETAPSPIPPKESVQNQSILPQNYFQKQIDQLQLHQSKLRDWQQQMQTEINHISSLQNTSSNGSLKIPTVHDSTLIRKGFNQLGWPSSKIYSSDSPLAFGLSAELFNFVDDHATETPTLNTWKISPHFGYRLTPHILFNSSITLENTGSEVHAPGSQQKGQTRVDFAYIDWLLSEIINFRLGQQLLPLGLINQRQDGTAYFSVNPPEVETKIIPSPWSENGLTFWGNAQNFHYQLGAFNSLVAKNFTQDTFIRDGRQNGQLAKAQNIAGVIRLDLVSPWTTLGVSGFVGSTSQDQSTIEDGAMSLYEAHLLVQWRSLNLRAVATEGQIKDPDSISIIAPGNPTIASKAQGYYVCLAVDILPMITSRGITSNSSSINNSANLSKELSFRGTASLPLFIEYSEYDLNAEVPIGKSRDPLLKHQVTTLGMNYRPVDHFAFKVDYQFRRQQSQEEEDVFSLGMSLVY